jgi:DMSO/TMAO reductase YedYZ molybdopterin-dependent catalytic subunit
MSSQPLNAETPLAALGTSLTPERSFYVRTHFDVPSLGADSWKLHVRGAGPSELHLSLRELTGLPSHEVVVTLECAGNGRRWMDPTPPGLAWGFGAVATARFTGVPVSVVLERAGLAPQSGEVLFEGADRGRVDSGEVAPFARSLPVEVARHPDTILAWAMNGRPLSGEHGFPVRLIVPRWYAMASVKWLVGVQALDVPFQGFFQKDDYVYADEAGLNAPVRLMRVRSVIAAPSEGADVPAGLVDVAGTAWSGHPPVVRVDVSVDGGTSWRRAELGRSPSPYAARPWRIRITLEPGPHVIMARATDRAGDTQPTEPVWNARGYGNNVIHRVRVNAIEARLAADDRVRVPNRGGESNGDDTTGGPAADHPDDRVRGGGGRPGLAGRGVRLP